MIVRRIALIVGLLLGLYTLSSSAQDNSFEVGTGSIASTFAPNPATFTTFTFATAFSEIPLVFALPSTQGGDECDIRIQNITLTTFEAYCTEAPPRDGEHVAVTMQYIAMTPETHVIPTTSGGSVTFEAGFIDTQTVQHNCAAASMCGTEGWDLITLSSVPVASASIITQIQTTVNESGTPPATASEPFLTTALDIDQGAANQIGLALERNEVDNGSITMDERIAWFAVEDTGGCETLDFSGRGGPSAVAFQSIVTDDVDDTVAGSDIHDAVDGWTDGNSNGCQTDEGATFEMGCFTNTPVVLATKRTRNEEDGGWLRQCFIGSDEIRLTIQEDRDRDSEFSHALEGVSVVAFGQVFTTPVTLSQINIQQLDRTVHFEWETATETFNVGFNLWGKLGEQWIQLNRKLIPSQRRDKLSPQKYRQRLRLTPHQRDQIVEFGISSVDVSGKDEFFGPFVSGQGYGEAAIPEPIDWQQVKAQYEQRMLGRGYQLKNGRWVRQGQRHRNINSHNTVDSAQQRINITVEKSGIYQISYEELLAKGVDWLNVRVRDIALTRDGRAVSRHVVSANNSARSRGRFGPGGRIEFFASELSDEEALYIQNDVYQLQLNRSLAQAMVRVDHQAVESAQTQAQAYNTVRAGDNVFYTELSAGDPWMDAEIFSFGNPAEKRYQLTVDEVWLAELGGKLQLRLSGGIDYPGIDQPDHHLQVYINGHLVADRQADGFLSWVLDIPIGANILQTGDNEIRLVLPGDTGFQVDIINVDTLALSVLTDLVWSAKNEQALSFTANPEASSYRVVVNADGGKLTQKRLQKPSVFVTQTNGNVARMRNVAHPLQDDGQLVLLLPTVAMQSELDDIQYWIGSPAQMLSPQISVVASDNLLADSADYLIVAHPNFMGETLEQFAKQKQQQGLSTRIVNWLDIVQHYGYGKQTPHALQRFLQAANQRFNYQYVLLVGGHSYDYLDYLQLGSVSFIPTWYRPQDVIQQAPTDTPYIDLDGDGLPDKAIGRWPVRTAQDLSAIVQKTQDWQENGNSSARSALFIAEQTEANRDFDLALENSLVGVTQRWSDVERVYLDDILANQPTTGLSTARDTILEQVNQGVGLTVFSGHGSPSSWTFQSLVSWQHLQQLDNVGLPTLVLPLACYTTYYQTPSVNSLAHQWLFSRNSAGEALGAVAIHGAMVLGSYRENNLFAEKIIKQQLVKGKTLGKAILQAKRQLAPWHQMINNWALLGDPSLYLEP